MDQLPAYWAPLRCKLPDMTYLQVIYCDAYRYTNFTVKLKQLHRCSKYYSRISNTTRLLSDNLNNDSAQRMHEFITRPHSRINSGMECNFERGMSIFVLRLIMNGLLKCSSYFYSYVRNESPQKMSLKYTFYIHLLQN